MVWCAWKLHDSDLTDPNGEGNGDFGDAVITELVIDYQKLFILENKAVTVTWFVNETCSTDIQVLGYTLFSTGPVLSDDHMFNVNVSTFTIPSDQYTSNGMDIDYRLIGDGMCLKNRDAYYYRFNGMLIPIKVWEEGEQHLWFTFLKG